MEKWRDLERRMRATGRYYPARVHARLLAKRYYKGQAAVRFDCRRREWRVAGYIALWPTKDPAVIEVGTFYVEQVGNGVGKEIFAEILQKIPAEVETAFTIMSDARAMRIALGSGFVAIGRNTLANVEAWAERAGIRNRLPTSALSEEPAFRDGERRLFVLVRRK